MLNVFQITTFFALLVTLGLGPAVYFVNPQRRANRHFLVATIMLALWLACLAFGSLSRRSESLLFWVRQASLTAFLVPLMFDLLRTAIVSPEAERWAILRELRVWLVFIAVAAIFCQLPIFVRAVEIDVTTGFPRPVYGPGQVLYVLGWICALAILGRRYTRDLSHATGIQRTELQFAVLAISSSALTGVGFGQIIPLLTGNQNVTQLMPLCAIQLLGIIAYGIVTERIMSVNDVLRRSTAYALLTVYLVGVYFVLQWLLHYALRGVLTNAATVSHVAATTVVLLSMAPARGRMQRVVNRLFINLQTMDIPDTMRGAQKALMSIGTIDQLLDSFTRIVTTAAGTDRGVILLAAGDGFVQSYPPVADKPPIVLPSDNAVAQLLRVTARPLSVDTLRRMRPSPQRQAATQQLSDMKGALAFGIHSKGNLDGILVLGRRLSGMIYAAPEQDALQLLCNQLGVAIENAKLYTTVQNSKIYNEVLLENLTSGVIAVNEKRVITLFNHEAQRVLRTPPERVGGSMDALPPTLARMLEDALETGYGQRDVDTSITLDGEVIHLRVGSSRLHSHTGEHLGGLLIFHDLSAVKKLQEQIRRSDRLASMGTLSAGMAHEIKNPLVTIKTFTQLMPERYLDKDFRESFFSLVGEEVIRIDRIVNQLLTFARPSTPVFADIHIQQVLHSSLQLVAQELRRRNIAVTADFTDDEDDGMRGDADLLAQAFVNFFLNALEAMGSGGELHVSTSVERNHMPDTINGVRPSGAPSITVHVHDTGEGIKAGDLGHIFDPFFTTKSDGTGLGLSVAHGIIAEQSGTIDVDSTPGAGTTFHIRFPLVQRGDGE